MRKVLWCDGDVIGEAHLVSLEDWVEDLSGWQWRMAGASGLIRPPKDSTLNLDPLIREAGGASGGRLSLKLAPMAAVTPEGRVIHLSGEVLADVPTEGLNSWVSVFVIPAEERPEIVTSLDSPRERARNAREKVAPTGTPEFYEPKVILKASKHLVAGGVEIAKIRLLGSLEVDRTFIPPCITMDSYNRLKDFAGRVLGALDGLAETCRKYRINSVRQSTTGVDVRALPSEELAREIENYWLTTSAIVRDLRASPSRFLLLVLGFLRVITRDAAELMTITVGDLPERLDDMLDNVGSGSLLSEITVKTESVLHEVTTIVEPLLRGKVLMSREIRVKSVSARLLKKIGEWEYTITLGRTLGEELDGIGAAQLTVRLELKEPVTTSVKIYANKTIMEIPEERKLGIIVRDNKYEFTYKPDATELGQKSLTFYTRSEPADQRDPKIILLGA